MVRMPVLCPHCHSDHVIKGGKTKAGQQRYKCQNTDCPHYSFQLVLLYKGRAPAIKEQIVDMSLNGSGIRDTHRSKKAWMSPGPSRSQIACSAAGSSQEANPLDSSVKPTPALADACLECSWPLSQTFTG